MYRLVWPVTVAACATGCGVRAVDVPSYRPEPGTTRTCRALVDALPRTVGDAIERRISPDVDTAAAWGDPPIVLRCGVALPTEYHPDAQLYEVDGVAWMPVRGRGGYFFTTIGRAANVEVAVPDEYAPEAQVLTELAEPIRKKVPPGTGPNAVR